ncbi:hypothetical protein [Duganella sp. S19_KUP01_CR8]|uniref:hypothetical protein n=1 Tax=Duganella sp. S19_KUP01_CR8 TaxID=3025502 RepID=UPI002FCDB4C4
MVKATIAQSPTAEVAVASNIISAASNAQELIIYINRAIDITEYRGTRAMLEGEGVIPADFEWPDAYSDIFWESGKFKYWLRRCRPDGAKGKSKAFADCDWWSLRWVLLGGPDLHQKRIATMAQDLAAEIYRWSDKGRDEWNRMYNRSWGAKTDEKFQAFKALIPGLVPPKRGRASKKSAPQGVVA